VIQYAINVEVIYSRQNKALLILHIYVIDIVTKLYNDAYRQQLLMSIISEKRKFLYVGLHHLLELGIFDFGSNCVCVSIINFINYRYSIVDIHKPIELQSTYWADIKSDVIHEFISNYICITSTELVCNLIIECTIKGQVKMDCALDERCANTCDNRNNSIQCPFPCVVRGCQCPEGKIVDELTNECVEPAKCLPSMFSMIYLICMYTVVLWNDYTLINDYESSILINH